MVSKQQKEVLRALVQKELDHVRRDNKTILLEMNLSFLKAEHEVEDFLEALLKSLK